MVKQARRPPSQPTALSLPVWLQHGWVQAVLVVAVAIWGYKKYRFSQFNNKPHPDAWYREPRQHRRYIEGLSDFVELYSQHLPSQSGGEDVGYEHMGQFTRCVTTQIAVTTYYCGSAAGIVDSMDRDSRNITELLSLLHALRLPPEDRAEDQLAQSLLGADWDGEELPQLVFRCHVNGDIDVVGHTLVIAMRPDLTFDLYQSFIQAYTLHQYLEANPRALTLPEMLWWLESVQELEWAETYTKEVDQLYRILFGASFARSTGYHGVKLRNREKDKGSRVDRVTGARGWELGEGEAVNFKWGLACTIPWNATALVGSE